MAKTPNPTSFAHLAGISARAPSAAKSDDDTPPKKDDDKDAKGAKGSKAEDEDKKQREGESDEDYAKRMDTEDDDADAKGSKAGKAGKDDSGKGGDEDDDPDEEMRGNSAAAAARRREQARCAAIFASAAAGANPVLAAKLAFTTRMPRDEALVLLEGTPAPMQAGARAAHPGRAELNPRVSSSAAQKPTGQAAVDASWAAIAEQNDKLYRR